MLPSTSCAFFSSSPSEPQYCGTLTLFEILCRTSGSQKYFIRLVRPVDNANLSPHRVMCPALGAALTNVNEASYALITSCRIRPRREVMGVTRGWNKGSIWVASDTLILSILSPLWPSCIFKVDLCPSEILYLPPFVCLLCSISAQNLPCF